MRFNKELKLVALLLTIGVLQADKPDKNDPEHLPVEAIFNAPFSKPLPNQHRNKKTVQKHEKNFRKDEKPHFHEVSDLPNTVSVSDFEKTRMKKVKQFRSNKDKIMQAQMSSKPKLDDRLQISSSEPIRGNPQLMSIMKSTTRPKNPGSKNHGTQSHMYQSHKTIQSVPKEKFRHPPPISQESFAGPPVQSANFRPPPTREESFAGPPVQSANFRPPPTREESFAGPPVHNANFRPPPTREESFASQPEVSTYYQVPASQGSVYYEPPQNTYKPEPVVPQPRVPRINSVQTRCPVGLRKDGYGRCTGIAYYPAVSYYQPNTFNRPVGIFKNILGMLRPVFEKFKPRSFSRRHKRDADEEESLEDPILDLIHSFEEVYNANILLMYKMNRIIKQAEKNLTFVKEYFKKNNIEGFEFE